MKHFFLLLLLIGCLCSGFVQAQTVNTKYERGELVKNKPVGAWKYYEGDSLALVINYDSSRVRYVRPDTARYQVWLDSTWQVRRLSRAPRLLGSRTAVVINLQERLRYPLSELAAGRMGNVVVSCIVFEDGQVSEPFVELTPSPGFSEEVRRAVNELPLRYVPGIYRGKRVRTKVQFSVKFFIQTSPTPKPSTDSEWAVWALNPVVYGGFNQIIVTALGISTRYIPHK